MGRAQMLENYRRLHGGRSLKNLRISSLLKLLLLPYSLGDDSLLSFIRDFHWFVFVVFHGTGV
jgi:hypothetical protein